MVNKLNPKYPLYIVSKNRADSRLTAKSLEAMNVPYNIVIEEFNYDEYAEVIDPKKILILPERYFDEYDVCDDLGRTKSTGPGAARNFVWDHSIEMGYDRHWVMDDNIDRFYRFNKNEKVKAFSGSIFRAMEDFCDRYENVAMAGPNYAMFVPRRKNHPPFIMNTRIYSCNLILNKAPYRWRGRYNEDTDLSLRMLKDGWCTIEFNAFLQNKVNTQVIQGGNTKEFYAEEGTLPKSKMQLKLHPDVSKVVMKYGRWHHHVDYGPFKSNKLIKKKNLKISKKVNNYGMVFRENQDQL